jgi:hypothetical protein
MTEIQWRYTGPSTSEEDIRSLEGLLAVVLPADYKSFIQEHSGARPRPNAIELPGGHEAIMERLLHIEAGAKGNLTSVAEALRKQGELSLVPFGSDPFGNLFCFKYIGKTAKAVVFWNHESNVSITLCATFVDLLKLLCPAGSQRSS